MWMYTRPDGKFDDNIFSLLLATGSSSCVLLLSSIHLPHSVVFCLSVFWLRLPLGIIVMSLKLISDMWQMGKKFFLPSSCWGMRSFKRRMGGCEIIVRKRREEKKFFRKNMKFMSSNRKMMIISCIFNSFLVLLKEERKEKTFQHKIPIYFQINLHRRCWSEMRADFDAKQREHREREEEEAAESWGRWKNNKSNVRGLNMKETRVENNVKMFFIRFLTPQRIKRLRIFSMSTTWESLTGTRKKKGVGRLLSTVERESSRHSMNFSPP